MPLLMAVTPEGQTVSVSSNTLFWTWNNSKGIYFLTTFSWPAPPCQVSLSDHEALLATFLVETNPKARAPSAPEVSSQSWSYLIFVFSELIFMVYSQLRWIFSRKVLIHIIWWPIHDNILSFVRNITWLFLMLSLSPIQDRPRLFNETLVPTRDRFDNVWLCWSNSHKLVPTCWRSWHQTLLCTCVFFFKN